jgi:charged multivesicular body protein 4
VTCTITSPERSSDQCGRVRCALHLCWLVRLFNEVGKETYYFFVAYMGIIPSKLKAATGGNASKGNGKATSSGQTQPAPKKAVPAKAASEAGGKLTATDSAVLDLKEQRDDLNRAARKAAKLSKALDEEARKYLRASPPEREKALRCIKRRKIYEEQLKRIVGLQDNVDSMLNAVESAQFEAQVFATLKEGGAALKALTKDMGDVEKTMEDVADAVADAQAISALLGEHVGAPVDEDDLEAELMQLVGQGKGSVAGKEPAQKTPTGVEGLEVPKHKLPDTTPATPISAQAEAEEEKNPERQRVAA